MAAVGVRAGQVTGLSGRGEGQRLGRSAVDSFGVGGWTRRGQGRGHPGGGGPGQERRRETPGVRRAPSSDHPRPWVKRQARHLRVPGLASQHRPRILTECSVIQASGGGRCKAHRQRRSPSGPAGAPDTALRLRGDEFAPAVGGMASAGKCRGQPVEVPEEPVDVGIVVLGEISHCSIFPHGGRKTPPLCWISQSAWLKRSSRESKPGSCAPVPRWKTTQPLAPTATTWASRPWAAMAVSSAGHGPAAEPVEQLVRRGVATSANMARVAAMASGLPLKVPTISYSPSATWAMTSAVPPTAAETTPPPMALARQMMSGVTPTKPVAPPGPAVSPVLTSSKVEQRAVGMEQVLEPDQVTGVGGDDPGVHHDRFDDHPGHPTGVGLENLLHGSQIVESDHGGEFHDAGRDPGAADHAPRAVRRAGLVEFGGHRHLDRVVVAVIAPLHLDQDIPPGDGPHQMDGVHGRLGTRIVEPPQREPESSPELLGHLDGDLGGLGEVGALPDLLAHRLDDGRMAVTGQAGAVAAVQVDVLIAVDVEDLGPGAVTEPDRLRRRDLPARGHTAGQRGQRPLAQSPRPGLALHESSLLVVDEGVEGGHDPCDGLLFCGHGDSDAPGVSL